MSTAEDSSGDLPFSLSPRRQSSSPAISGRRSTSSTSKRDQSTYSSKAYSVTPRRHSSSPTITSKRLSSLPANTSQRQSTSSPSPVHTSRKSSPEVSLTGDTPLSNKRSIRKSASQNKQSLSEIQSSRNSTPAIAIPRILSSRSSSSGRQLSRTPRMAIKSSSRRKTISVIGLTSQTIPTSKFYGTPQVNSERSSMGSSVRKSASVTLHKSLLKNLMKTRLSTPKSFTPNSKSNRKSTNNRGSDVMFSDTSITEMSNLTTPRGVLLQNSGSRHSRTSSKKRVSWSSTGETTVNTTFDFESIETPNIPLDRLVSPLSSNRKRRNDSWQISSINEESPDKKRRVSPPKGRGFSASTSPKNDLTDVHGLKKLMQTPREIKSPRNDLRDIRGVKKLMKTPKPVRSPKNDIRDVRGVKKLMKTPKPTKSPRNDLRDVRGVKKIMKTPIAVKSPKNDLTDVRGVKKLMKTPKMVKSPRNDLRDVRGVKKIMQSPKIMKSPRNDLRDVRGLKKLMQSPKIVKSPRNDLSDVRGVKKLMQSPKTVKSPRNDLRDVRGLKKLMQSPRNVKSPRNDLTDVAGVKRLMSVRSPKNNLSDFLGVEDLFHTPSPKASSSRSQEISQPELTSFSPARKGINTKGHDTATSPDQTHIKQEASVEPTESSRRKRMAKRIEPGLSPKRQRRAKTTEDNSSIEDKVSSPQTQIETSPLKTRRGTKVASKKASPVRRGRNASGSSNGALLSPPRRQLRGRNKGGNSAQEVSPSVSAQSTPQRGVKVKSEIETPHQDANVISEKVSSPTPKRTRRKVTKRKSPSPILPSPASRKTRNNRIKVDSPAVSVSPKVEPLTPKNISPKMPLPKKTRARLAKAIPQSPSDNTSLEITLSPVPRKTRGKTTKRKSPTPVIEASPEMTATTPVSKKTRGKTTKSTPTVNVSPKRTRGKMQPSLEITASPVSKKTRGKATKTKSPPTPVVSPKKTRNKTTKTKSPTPSRVALSSPVPKKTRSNKTKSSDHDDTTPIGKTKGKKKVKVISPSPVKKSPSPKPRRARQVKKVAEVVQQERTTRSTRRK
ncbi:hypothetical protein C0J52_08163 [Blattella germanica]|nr:hypothetical protein C0J52_08163 [Blattella germanica]